MQQAVDAFFQFDKGTVVGQVAYLALDRTAFRISLGHAVPRVLLSLLHAERELLALAVDTQDHHVDFVADANQFVGVIDPFRPRHFADVDQAFDAWLQLDERPVAHHVHNRAVVGCAFGVLLLHIVPRVWLFLLQAKCNLLLFAVDVQDHHVDILVQRNHLGRMIDTFPAHVGNVQQTVDAAQIDKGPKLGDVLDHALAGFAIDQFLKQPLAILLALLLDQRTTADHDIPSRFVDLQNFALDETADVIANVRRATDVDLAGRQENIDADIDQQTAFDFARNRAGDHLALLHGIHDIVPLDQLLGFATAQTDHAVRVVGQAQFILHLFDQDFDRVANHGRIFVGVPFMQWDRAFALETDIDKCRFVVHADYAAIDDLVDIKFLLGIKQTDELGGIFDVGHRRLEQIVNFLVALKVSYQISVYHSSLR